MVSRGVVEPANYNEPEQTVISGNEQPVALASEFAAQAGARVVPLRVGAPFHCSLMSVLDAEIGAALDAVRFTDPARPVVANVTGDYVRTAAAVRQGLQRQVAGAVRWTQTMRRLLDDGYDAFIEVGPGRVLSGFAMKTAPDVPVYSTGEARRLERLLAEESATRAS